MYTTYYNLELFKKILIIERTADTSLEIIKMLNEGNIAPFEIQTMQIKSNDLPQTAEELCAWDQVILNNIAFADMPSGYDEELNEYVHTYGGGMLTVGGMKEDGETANAYNREDLYGTAYQSMLPVEAIEYTPPVGVIFLVDTSGSMGGSSDSEGETRLDYAKTGVFAAMKVLSPRDYMGIMTFDSVEDKVLDLTPVTREEEIIKALNTLTPNGGTTLAPALESAYISLNSLDKVAKRHIVVVTDAAISDKPDDYEGLIKANYPNVTLSVVCIDGNLSGENLEKMQNAVELGGGRLIQATREDVTVAMREELCAEAIKETVYETFNPIVYTRNSPLVKNMVYLPNSSSHLAVQLDGFHGTKVREGAELILMGDYEVPIYAQWKYGKGTVGSFMCDLTGHWSSEFINSIVGRTFITNVVNNLMPTESLRPSDIKVVLTEDNYTNEMSVFSTLKEGEKIVATVQKMLGETVLSELKLGEVSVFESKQEMHDADFYVLNPLDASSNYTRCTFVVTKGGVYKITLNKVNDKNEVVDTYYFFKSFSYSEEYLSVEQEVEEVVGEEQNTPKDMLVLLAAAGNGSFIEDLNDRATPFEGFVKDIDKTFDPRILFLILTLILMLLDIAVRKFKFKWPHELIKQWKENREKKQ
ncbi:MAG: VWA domain-containing protein [Clostridia bacterium]|nr:VWA domain-containing protein [Clostridia bacterium]